MRLPLDSVHRALGATFHSISDWEVPESYGDPVTEYRVMRTSVGLFDCSYWGKVLLTGKDRASFLHRITSNDVVTLKPGEGSYNTILTPKGRMLSSFWVHVLGEALFLEAEGIAAGSLVSLLDQYKFTEVVGMEDVTGRWGGLLLAGPSAPRCVARLVGSDPPPLAPGASFEAQLSGEKVYVVHRPATGLPEFTLYVREEGIKGLWDAVLQAGEAWGIRPVGWRSVEILRIEAGLPRFGSDMDDFIIPVEAGLEEQAISYTKGCYVGQEVIARIKTYGHVNKRLMGLRVEGDRLPATGSKIIDPEGKEVGWITSAVFSPGLGGVIALGYVRPQAASEGAAVSVAVDDRRTEATVSRLPFPMPGIGAS